MKPASLIVQKRTYVACLVCAREVSTVDHLVEDAARLGRTVSWGPWYCDHCGNSVRGEVRADGSVHVEEGRDQKEDRAVLLAYHAVEGAEPVYLVVKGMRFVNPTKPTSEADEVSAKRYYYEAGTCPVNYLRSTLGVILGLGEDADADPHGLFAYVADVPIKGNEAVLSDGTHSIDGTAQEVLALFGVGRPVIVQ